MAKWNKVVITDAGKSIIAQAMSSSSNVSIEKMRTSSHDYAGADLEKLISLMDIKQEVPVDDIRVIDNTMLRITSNLSNFALTESYKLATIGAYGRVGAGEETLIAVITASDPDTMAPVSNSNVETDILEFYIKMESTEVVDVHMRMDDYLKRQEIFDLVYPVGAIFISTGAANPNVLFGGTWEKITGRYLFASGQINGNTYNAGSTIGESTHRITYDEMPSHNHNRGNMEIWGSMPLPTHTGRWDRFVRGAFTTEGGNGGSVSRQVEGSDFEESRNWWDITYSEFHASRAWSGQTSNEGRSQAMPMLPLGIAVDVWKRTA